MATPVINSVVKTGVSSISWTEGVDYGWWESGTNQSYTTGWKTVSVENSSISEPSTAYPNITGSEAYFVGGFGFRSENTASTGTIKLVHDGVDMESYDNNTTSTQYAQWSTYGGVGTPSTAGSNSTGRGYSFAQGNLGVVKTMSAAVTVVAVQYKGSSHGHFIYIYASKNSWIKKTSLDTAIADKAFYVNNNQTVDNNYKMYVDKFSFICHGNGWLKHSGFTSRMDGDNFIPHDIDSMVSNLNFVTGGTGGQGIPSGDYAMFINGTIVRMT